MNKYQLALTVLDRALTTKRPHGDPSTQKFCSWLMKLMPKNAFTDKCGNIHVDQRGHGAPSRSLFVAHVDTVHRVGGKNNVIKTDKKWSASGAPLGADDGAGVALLMHMMHHRVPGYYIFTQGEEVGGIGAGWLADNMPNLLRQFDRAIAFDRRATYSVITHQGMGRCASDEFGDELSNRFNNAGMLFATDDGGVYTDTAEFVEFIPECTNISAGYDMEHTPNETLDMEHFMDLCRVVIKLEWDTLPVVRDPKAKPKRKVYSGLSKYERSAWMGAFANAVIGGKAAGTKGTPVSKDFDLAEYPASYDEVTYDDLAARFDDEPADPVGNTANDDLPFMTALEAAMDGQCSALVKMMAEAADPENPRAAEKQISRKLMSEGFLCQMYDDSFALSVDDLLLEAFEEIACSI
jgi:hypothetical protein